MECTLYLDLGFNDAVRHYFFVTPLNRLFPFYRENLYLCRVNAICPPDMDHEANVCSKYLGGTNEMVVSKMHKELEEECKKNLKVYWYTGESLSHSRAEMPHLSFLLLGKDQSQPINASAKKRNCHSQYLLKSLMSSVNPCSCTVKIMIVDDQIGIQGNGNQGEVQFSFSAFSL